jgi:hypothetical protein
VAEPERGYLLQIRDGGRIVAEAPLIIHDQEATWRLFSEGFGMMAHMAAGALYNTVRVACDEAALDKVGPQVALKLETPSALVTPQVNGNMP